jgi:N-acylneuraminate cytidylyltransferase
MLENLPSCVALIPARSGSKRIKNKNVRRLDGHPLIAYTIKAAIDSGVFDAVICVTDSQYYANIAEYYGAEAKWLRPSKISGDFSPDIEWVQWVFNKLSNEKRKFDVFSILRPTSPFRLSSTIQRAWSVFHKSSKMDSLRAVEKCEQHPGKMWILKEDIITPLMPNSIKEVPWHNCQYASLPEIYIQNASLEIAWTSVISNKSNISGSIVTPFFTEEFEGFDINKEKDWLLAQYYIDNNLAKLPNINMPPFTDNQ